MEYNRATNYKIPPYHDKEGAKEGRDRAGKFIVSGEKKKANEKLNTMKAKKVLLINRSNTLSYITNT